MYSCLGGGGCHIGGSSPTGTWTGALAGCFTGTGAAGAIWDITGAGGGAENINSSNIKAYKFNVYKAHAS